MDKSYLSLDYDFIKERFPLSLRAVEEWFLKNNDIAKGLKMLGADMTHSSAMSKVVMSVIMFDPRKLYDVFDDLDCRICITDRPEYPGTFCYYNSMKRESRVGTGRKNAELFAFMEAFEVLEKNLADGKNKERVQTSD